MARQPISPAANNNAKKNRPFFKLLLCVCVAGLLCFTLYKTGNSANTSPATQTAAKQSCSGGGSNASQNMQCKSAASSLIPGRLSRFLQ